jgi:hypothetical protein
VAVANKADVRQASSLAKCKPRTEDYALEVKTAENSGCSEMCLSFHWLSQRLRARFLDEQLSESSAFGSCSRDLHSGFRRRQTELREDGQELPYERQQGVQLR